MSAKEATARSQAVAKRRVGGSASALSDARNQALGPANIKRMVLASRRQVSMGMVMLRVLNRLPGKDRMMARIVEPIHRAATAITLKAYR